MSTTATLDQQIDYMERHIAYQRKVLPLRVEEGRITQERATTLLASASSALQTLTQLRGMVRIGEAA